MPLPPDATRAQRVVEIIELTLAGILELGLDDWEPPTTDAVSEEIVTELASVADGVRDLALLLLGYCAAEGRPLNLLDPGSGDLASNKRLPGDRAASDAMAAALRALGIQHTNPLQNSTFRAGYESPQARRASTVARFLHWVSDPLRSFDDVRTMFECLAARIAATANAARPLPPLDQTRLTFAAVMNLFDRLLSMPSGGAYEQYGFAAMLDAVLDEEGGSRRVITGQLNAADTSTGRAGDVEVRLGQNLVEAYEVSASDWLLKAPQAVRLLISRVELRRVAIVARGAPTGDEIPEGLKSSALPPGVDPGRLDIAVLDLRNEIASMVARAQRHARRAGLERLYDCLRDLQANTSLVDALVDLIDDLQLAITTD